MKKKYLIIMILVLLSMLVACQGKADGQQTGIGEAQVVFVSLSDAEKDITLRHPTFLASMGKYAFVTGGETNNVVVVDLETLKPVK
ncbi:MAG: hypothetical protein OEZ02_06395 [Anaerolineae bacterium]|nr:hypothetical protein [Anaerolineae bacterium]